MYLLPGRRKGRLAHLDTDEWSTISNNDVGKIAVGFREEGAQPNKANCRAVYIIFWTAKCSDDINLKTVATFWILSTLNVPSPSFPLPSWTNDKNVATQLVLRTPDAVVTLEHSPLDTVRCLKNRAMEETIRRKRCETSPSLTGLQPHGIMLKLKGDGVNLDDYNAPLQLYDIKDGSKIELLSDRRAEDSYTVGKGPLWPWRSLPLDELHYPGRYVRSCDIQTFNYLGSRTICFMNRTHCKRVNISCFPAENNASDVKGETIGTPPEPKRAGNDILLELRKCFGAQISVSLETHGSFELVAIPKGPTCEMAVVLGVGLPAGGTNYKMLKFVQGGRQIDVLEAFVNHPTIYRHPANGGCASDALRERFLCKYTV